MIKYCTYQIQSGPVDTALFPLTVVLSDVYVFVKITTFKKVKVHTDRSSSLPQNTDLRRDPKQN